MLTRHTFDIILIIGYSISYIFLKIIPIEIHLKFFGIKHNRSRKDQKSKGEREGESERERGTIERTVQKEHGGRIIKSN